MNKRKKYIAPIVTTVFVVLYYAFLLGVIAHFAEGIWKYVVIIVTVLMTIAIIYVCIDRIIDIKGGEDDDISNY